MWYEFEGSYTLNDDVINRFPSVDFHNEPMPDVCLVCVEYSTQMPHGSEVDSYSEPNQPC